MKLNRLNKYLFVAQISARSNLAYFSDVGGRFVFLAVVLYILLKLWQVTYAETGAHSLGGLTLAQMLWYLTITESIMMSAPKMAQVVDEDVRTGALAVQLTRPLSYPLYQLSSVLGERCVRFLMCISIGSLLTFFLVGPINLHPLGLAMFVSSLPLAAVLDFLGYFLIGLGAFWLEDTSGLVLIYSRFTMILGGMLLPMELFPEVIRPLLKTLPFSSIVWGPARLFVKPNLSDFGNVFMHQLLGCLVFAVVISVVYSMALKRVAANGG